MRITKMLRDLGVFDRTTITGQLDDDENSPFCAMRMSLCYHPIGRIFGISVVEAMACGLPVLISDKVGIWREIAEAEAGIVNHVSIRENCECNSDALSDPGLRMALGQRGKNARRCAQFSIDRMAERMETAYQSFCDVA